MDLSKVKVIVKILNTEGLLAIANVIDGEWRYQGFQIFKSPKFNERLQENIMIKPPQRTDGNGRYRNLLSTATKNWYRLEELIYSAFLKARDESPPA